MKKIELYPKEIVEIKQLAKNTRKSFGINDEVPIANDMKMLLDKQGIILCEYPFGDDSKIDAEIVRFESDDKPLIFIGLNSSLYYDEQIFAMAHEIYHFETKTGMAYSQNDDHEDERLERKADRFAAELLLPEEVIRNAVIMEFDQNIISDSNILRVLRFIALLQNTWWLPYKSIVLRLQEEGLIDDELFGKLYNEYDSRDAENDYYKILNAIDKDTAELLNAKTKKTSVSNKVIDAIIKNYDDEYITEDEFVELMNIFNIEPSDYGYEVGTFDFEDFDTEGDVNEN
jgi:Zn-dependent peptidase ImmA (M78 family)